MITSLSNAKIKRAAGLRRRQARDESGLTLVDGLREVVRAKEAGFSLEDIYVCPSLLKAFAGEGFLDRILAWPEDPVLVSETVFEKISFGDRREGVLAVARVRPCPLDAASLPENPLIAVLEGVEKPGNLGAVLRVCDGAGVDAVIAADTKTDLFNPGVIRASTGVVFSMRVMQGASSDVRDMLSACRVKIIAAAPSAEQNYISVNMTGPSAFIFGAEAAGLSDFWLEAADARVSVPMLGQADSLNVSVTAAVLVYEARRQRGF